MHALSSARLDVWRTRHRLHVQLLTSGAGVIVVPSRPVQAPASSSTRARTVRCGSLDVQRNRRRRPAQTPSSIPHVQRQSQCRGLHGLGPCAAARLTSSASACVCSPGRPAHAPASPRSGPDVQRKRQRRGEPSMAHGTACGGDSNEQFKKKS